MALSRFLDIRSVVLLRQRLQPGGEQHVLPVVDRAVDDGGHVLRERLLQNGHQVVRTLDAIALTAHAFGQHHEIRVREAGHVRVAEAVVLLPLDQPVGAVVEDQGDKGKEGGN